MDRSICQTLWCGNRGPDKPFKVRSFLFGFWRGSGRRLGGCGIWEGEGRGGIKSGWGIEMGYVNLRDVDEWNWVARWMWIRGIWWRGMSKFGYSFSQTQECCENTLHLRYIIREGKSERYGKVPLTLRKCTINSKILIRYPTLTGDIINAKRYSVNISLSAR